MASAGDPVKIRKATLADVSAIGALIAASSRTLAAGDYSADQIEAALLGAWGVDTEIIRDATYFVGEVENEIVLSGGWSTEAARIRAFFVHPRWARRGLASRLLALCEDEARSAGFMAAELVATLPGERLYARHGYIASGRRSYALPHGASIDFVPMRKAIGPAHDGSA